MPARSVIFWNVQRLFDAGAGPIAASLGDSTALAMKPADVTSKVATIARVIDVIAASTAPPALVGFTEVASTSLARRIARAVRSAELIDVDARASDRAGVRLAAQNVVLLYAADVFNKVTSLRSHILDLTFDTRDVLEVVLRGRREPGLKVLVNHWPSRLNPEGAPKRLSAGFYTSQLVANAVRYSAAEVWDESRNHLDLPPYAQLEQRSRSPVIVMGDFNDEPFDSSLEALGAVPQVSEVQSQSFTKTSQARQARLKNYASIPVRLYNPFWALATGDRGTCFRSPRWRTYDQILLSRGLVEPATNAPIQLVPSSAAIHQIPEVRVGTRNIRLTNRNGKPLAFEPSSRTGCSDHFAVSVTLDFPA